MRRWFAALLLLSQLPLATSAWSAEESSNSEAAEAKVSYHVQIRPLLQAHCQGCHQPAKAGGEYVMTSFDRLAKGGESTMTAIVPGKPDESYLIELITPENGKAEMPKGKPALAAAEIELIRKWISEGAVDDSPANTRERYDADHPPVYTRPPVITSLDFSPDGQLLAVAGFHEVLLVQPESGELTGRLVGLSERIESVRFSPDGTKLAVTGGLPGRTGEVQVWNVAERTLLLSVPITYDTVYGGNWSPDGTLIAIGCGDNSLRAINAETGEQVLFQGAHEDWVRDTAFSVAGTHVVSVSRDMTVKLTEVATQRFIDNVTSITPGALKGGLTSVARHPKFDHILVGGSDGVPKVYRIFRETARVIGDDANLIFPFFPMTGRVFSVQFSEDGKRMAAASSLDGRGELLVCTYDYDADVPQNIKAIMGKVPGARKAEEKKALEDYKQQGVKLLSKVELPQSSLYAVAFHPGGEIVAAAGSDGTVRLIAASTGTVMKEFSPAPLNEAAANEARPVAATNAREETVATETLPEGAGIVSLQVEPSEITLSSKFDYAQLLVSATLASGEKIDVTRLVQPQLTGDLVHVSRTGLVRPKADGQTSLQLTLAGQSATVPVTVAGLSAEQQVDFVRDVNPVLSKLGCNQGTCHGAQNGKNGFKLSLRGYDPIFDVRALTDDLASRRVNVASPDASLMLLKSTGSVPHVGGQLTRPGEPYYETIRNWIAGGAKLELSTPRVTKIDIQPANPVVQQLGSMQQMRVVATYADGMVRDVSREAFVETGNAEVATASSSGLMTAVRRGEAPMLARYEGAYAATTLTAMGDRTGFVWQQPETWGRIDELVAAKWERMKIQPSDLCSDAEFIRRATLDLTGLPPSADDVRAFLADTRETRVKRDELVERLVGGEQYIEYWTNRWADLLQVNGKFLGREGAAAFRQWIRHEVATNTPYDQFARKVLTASGSNRENPPASYYKILREPVDMMENTTHLFLAVRFNCNKCHDHPFERWTQDQYYETAAYFAQIGLKKDPESGDKTIGGSAVEGAKPLYEVVFEKPDGEVTHERTGQVVAPEFPFPAEFPAGESASRREKLAAWITSPDNEYFARSYVNRLWGYMFGTGIIEPIDDLRAGNPATNPELLDYLTAEFVESGFNVQHVLKLIGKSRAYQLSVATNRWNEDDDINYSHAVPKRLPAEVLYDAIYQVTGAVSKFPGVPAGTRAAALPDVGIEVPSGFLNTFGRPPRESSCECERSTDLQLGPVMALISGPTVSEAIDDPNNEVAKLAAREPDSAKLINELFLRVLNRPAAEREIEAATAVMGTIDADHQKLLAAMNAREEYFAPIRTKLEEERQQAIAGAKTELETYQTELQPKIEEMERQRQALIAQRQTELGEYEAALPARFTEWESTAGNVPWTILKPVHARSSNDAKLDIRDDGTLFVSGATGKASYVLRYETDLAAITGIRIEALSDPELPGQGPGRAQNGNFVLSEIIMRVAPKATPENPPDIPLQNALADFSQGNYEVATAIDGKQPGQNNGWAISPQTGRTHWATFETKENVGAEGGSVLTFVLNQNYNDGQHTLGKFRISITNAPRPVGLGVAGEVTELLAVAPETRSDEQKAKLLEFFRNNDEELKKRQQALAEAQKPLPEDPKLTELKQKFELVSRPVPEDPKLAQLKRDFEMSQKQVANQRLTAAQDLAWALINSPAFLFNH